MSETHNKHSQAERTTGAVVTGGLTTGLPCIVILALFVVFKNVDLAGAVWSCPLGILLTRALAVVESLALAAVSQALQDRIFNQQVLLQDLGHALLSLWLVLFVAFTALLLRMVFGDKVPR
jgi:hypothetical protein